MRINIINLQKKIPFGSFLENKIKAAVRKTASVENVNGFGGVTVCLLDNKRIKELNKKYLGKNLPTDVISFSIADSGKPGYLLAEIAVSGETAVSNAKIFKTNVLQELLLYVIHGFLHSLGYLDATRAQRKVMQKKEAKILGLLN